MKNKILLIIIVVLVPISIPFLIAKKNTPNIETPELTVNVKLKDTTINIPLEDYVTGVVAAEMPALFLEEALKTQAIISRTFALYLLQSRNYLTLADQAYLTNEELKDKWQEDYDTYYQKISSQVLATKNLVITYDNQLIKSYYYAMSNGKTADVNTVFNETYPYIAVIDSTYDNETQKNFSVTTTFTFNDFCTSLSIPCQNLLIENIIIDNSNRVVSLTINNKDFTGLEIRQKLNLRSTDFTITKENDLIFVTTKGYGHGVGLSQYGANGMAKNGANYEEIIKYYYQNVEIQDISCINLNF